MRDTDCLGLFGYIGMGGEVQNLSLEGAQVDYTGTSGSDFNSIGLLAGRSAGAIVSVGTGGMASGSDSH